MGEPESPVSEQGTFTREVPECAPPLIESDLPLNGFVFILHHAQLHDEAAQCPPGLGARVPGQVPGHVHLQVEQAALMFRVWPHVPQRGGEARAAVADEDPGSRDLLEQC